MNKYPLLWLRAEHKPLEKRTAVTPQVAAKLIDKGFTVVVEESSERAIALSNYIQAGCTIVARGSWRDAPQDAIIVGLKELSPALGPFRHRHIHFAHIYKRQQGWQQMLHQFQHGGGVLYDLEYLVGEDGRRVAAFGYWAGYVGAALSLLAWAGQQRNQAPVLDSLTAWPDRDSLRQAVDAALVKSPQAPKAIVLGALGRSGRGAVELCQAVGVSCSAWDQAETKTGGPFDQLLEHQIMINCVFVEAAIKPFTTLEHLAQEGRQLSVICDVSCDPFAAANPLPLYQECTSIDSPVTRLINRTPSGTLALDLIAIDHLPSLLPVESSEDFSAQLEPHLLQLDRLDQGVWMRAGKLFERKCLEALAGEEN